MSEGRWSIDGAQKRELAGRHLAVLVLHHHRPPPAAALALLRAVAGGGRRLPIPSLRAGSGSGGGGVAPAAGRSLYADTEGVELLAHAGLEENLRGAQAAEVGLGVAGVDEREAEDDARARLVKVGASLVLVPRLDEAAEGGVEEALLCAEGGELVAEGGVDGSEAHAPAQAQEAVGKGVECNGELVVAGRLGLLAFLGPRGFALRFGRGLLLSGCGRGIGDGFNRVNRR